MNRWCRSRRYWRTCFGGEPRSTSDPTVR